MRAADRKRLRALMLMAALVALALLLVALSLRPAGAGGRALRSSGQVPPLAGPALPAGRVSPGLYAGKVVVINVWASWCAPCREEQPLLERLWREYRGRGVQFVGVNLLDDRTEALAYLEEFGVTYPSLPDPQGRLALRLGMLAPPATFLADREGRLRYHLLGAQSEEHLRRYLDELLGEEP